MEKSLRQGGLFVEKVKIWTWRLVFVLLMALYLILALWNGICYHGIICWDRDLWGYIVRYTAEGGELLSYIAPYICYPIAYRLRTRRWICLLLMSLPALLALPMALCLGWRGWPLG